MVWRKFRNKSHQADPALNIEPPAALPDRPNLRGRSGSEAQENIHRSPTQKSAISTFAHLPYPTSILRPNSGADAERSRSRSRDRRLDPLGLNVVYDPGPARTVDIIFVHGLGGTSRQTWSKNRNPDLFWPQTWLPSEPETACARILSFGYNVNFKSIGPKSLSGVTDFAKDLLFEMRFGKDNKSEDLNIGKIPVIFVVHSMGGLVAKKAYILGKDDNEYRSVLSSVSAMVFLATPHRGTGLAEILNKILSVSIALSPKQYITELNKNSPALEEINEQFRHIAPKIQIVSFYETLETPLGIMKLMVLDKDSSILGYPDEISKQLYADHHDVCKYSSPQDPNYISVRNILAALVARCRAPDPAFSKQAEDFKKVDVLLAVYERPDNDCSFFRDRWMPDTCDWILSDPSFQAWADQSKPASILWLHALPASGKSVLCSYVINYLKESGALCQYFFFRFGDQAKRSPTELLRSIASQIARDVPSFRRRLSELSDDGLRLDKADARSLWKALFVTKFISAPPPGPLYWVVDALDESDHPSVLLELFSIELSSLCLPIRVIFTSRHNQKLSLAFDRLAVHNTVRSLALDTNHSDISIYIEKEVEYIVGTVEFKRDVITRILERANRNFLWVHITLQEICQCHSSEEIDQILRDVPPEMEVIYERMQKSITQNAKPSERELARNILMWTTCARRSLYLHELAEALRPDFPVFLDLRRTIGYTCGELIVVDAKNRVTMVHQTARDYLINTPDMPLSIHPPRAHTELFRRSISVLMDRSLRSILRQIDIKSFLLYAATSWAYHLNLTLNASDESLDLLTAFFRGPFVLTWINLLAIAEQLKVLVYASHALETFTKRRRKGDIAKSPLLHRLRDLETLDLWALDLLKLIGKFGSNLGSNPESIYKIIPQFCPYDSMMYQQFGQKSISRSVVSVTGISSTSWDDSLAKLSIGNDNQGLSVSAAGRYIGILTITGTICLIDALTLQITRRIPHNEIVSTMAFSSDGDLLVSYGFHTCKVWHTASGKQLHRIPNPVGSRALEMKFTDNDSTILMCSDDKLIRKVALERIRDGWQTPDPAILREESTLEGAYTNTPCWIAFNTNASYIAVAYRGFPLSVWGLDKPRLIGRCKRMTDQRRINRNAWTGVDRVTWHPYSGDVLGLYNDGCAFKWHPFEDESQEVMAGASEIVCSPDGVFFATSDANGVVKLWNFQHFSLVYQLMYENPVTDLAFSPDCRQLYDIRGSFCNIWEPNVLIRMSETDERASELGSITHTSASEVDAKLLSPIVSLAAVQNGNLYCVGNDEGFVQIFDPTKGYTTELWRSATMMTIDQLVFDQSGQRIAATEIGGKVVVKSIKALTSNTQPFKWEVNTILDTRVNLESGGIQGLLLHPHSKFLFLPSQTSAQVWSLAEKEICASTIFKNPRTIRKWINHPLDPSSILAFEYGLIVMYRWQNLTEVATGFFDLPELQPANLDEISSRRPSGQGLLSPSEMECSIDRVLLSQCGTYILAEFALGKQICVFKTAALSLPEGIRTVLEPTFLPSAIVCRVKVTLGILPTDHFVFVNMENWVCTWRLGSGDDAPKIRQHYFLPRDWVNADCLRLCLLLADGTLLCPKDGEVAVIRSDLRSDW
ncbi:hypothetical protein MMC27_004281 [Xylographa pallens]|nr:hypothetical protein [Xylographa pallens]